MAVKVSSVQATHRHSNIIMAVDVLLVLMSQHLVGPLVVPMSQHLVGPLVVPMSQHLVGPLVVLMSQHLVSSRARVSTLGL